MAHPGQRGMHDWGVGPYCLQKFGNVEVFWIIENLLHCWARVRSSSACEVLGKAAASSDATGS